MMDPNTVASVGRVPHGGNAVDDDFSTNCNPRVPDGAREVYETAFETARSYPTGYPDYRATAAEYVGCSPERVIPTAGGLAAIRLAVEVTVSDARVLIPYPSFGEYAREVRLQGATPTFVPYDELLATDLKGYALAVICTPNNPTGELPARDRLLAFAARCRAVGTPLLVDEAFLDFTEQSSLAGTPGVVVARSLTKMFGLPGLRAGFLVAGDLYERLRAAVSPWTLGAPAAAVGTHCLRATEFVNKTRERVETERERMRHALASRFEVSPSHAPFLLLDVGDRDPASIIASLRSQNIAVRDATTFRGLDSHVRVAVRLPKENDRLVEALLDLDV